ncbi:unnamed protein product [Urochloa humidicola]
MVESSEFATELFDPLNYRWKMQVDKINEGIHEIWQQITNNSFNPRLQIFNKVDKNRDGCIIEAEIKR